MTDAERLKATSLFIAALSDACPDADPIPFEPSTFAEVVAELQAQGNAFAVRFAVYETVAGKSCPDFQYGMTAAQSAGLIARQNPTYQYFSVRMARRIASELLQKEEEALRAAVNLVAHEYCRVLEVSQA